MLKQFIIALRVITGLVFLIKGFDKLYPFLTQPAFEPAAQAFYGALMSMGYFIFLLGLIESLSGILLMINQFVPLSLAFLAPVVVNITLFHIFLDPGGLPIALYLLVSEFGLIYFYRHHFLSVLTRKANLEQAN